VLRSEAWETWGTGPDHEQFKHKACGGLMRLMSLLPDDLINDQCLLYNTGFGSGSRWLANAPHRHNLAWIQKYSEAIWLTHFDGGVSS
jgi:hypothetical protein